MSDYIEGLKRKAEIQFGASQHKKLGTWKKVGNILSLGCGNCGSKVDIDLDSPDPIRIFDQNYGTGRCLDQFEVLDWKKYGKLP